MGHATRWRVRWRAWRADRVPAKKAFCILARMRMISVLSGVLTIGFATVQSRAQNQEVPLKVSLCEVKAHPENFLHKLVEFTATASHGFEDSMVEDGRCSWPKGGPGVWMEYGGKRSTATMYCCGFTPKPDRDKTLVVDGISLDLVDDVTFRTFNKLLHPVRAKPGPSSTVKATLRGRIFGRYEGIGGTQQGLGWRGYGHMDCCMLFIVTQVVSVEPPRP
jgi:hypothetical protein